MKQRNGYTLVELILAIVGSVVLIAGLVLIAFLMYVSVMAAFKFVLN